MQYATECGLFSASDLQILNYCRLYLHVTTVSELFDATGTMIMPAMFNCKREEWFDPTTNVSLQRRPSEYQIRWKWQKLCRQWSMESGSIVEAAELGNWVVSGKDLRRRRRSYIVEFPYRRLYHWHTNSYWECQPLAFEENTFRLLRTTDWVPITECTPVEIQITACGYLELKEIARPVQVRSGVRVAPDNFCHYVATLAPWEKQLLSNIELLTEPTNILQSLENTFDDDSILLLVSDGSVRGTQMTYGWVFGTNEKEVFAQNSGAGAGSLTSHRAEAWGLLSGCLFVYHFIQFSTGFRPEEFPLQKIKFLSDNKGLVVRVQQRQTYASSYPNAALAPDWEIVEQIHETIASISLQQVEVDWVKGHQDENEGNLSVEAEFNVQADKIAGDYKPTDLDKAGLDGLLPLERCRLKIGRESIHGHYRVAIREAYTLPPYFAYLREKHGWTLAEQDTIDWSTFKSAVSIMGVAPVQLLKLLHNKLPTNSEQSKSSAHQSRRCTYCECDETFYHLLTCQNDRSQRHRELLFTTAQHFLQQKNAPMEFQTGFLYCLAVSLQRPPLTMQDNLTPRMSDCVDTQTSLGIHLFLRGFIVTRWRSILLSDSESRESLLLPRLLTILWKCQLAFWEEHVQTVNQSSAQSHMYRDTLDRLRSHVRYLHSKRDLVLAAHRDHYFYEEVEDFLKSATKPQMKQYIHHYEPAITASIKAAESQPTRTLLFYTGFHRISQSVRRTPLLRNIVHGHRRDDLPHDPTRQRGDQLRKHTRWKTPVSAMNSLRNYFTTT